MFSPVQVGKRTRYSYARIKEVMEMPHLLDIQRNSYKWFLQEGLREILEDISPITISTGNLKLFFKDPVIGKPKYTLEECKERDGTYSAPIRVKVQLVNHEMGDVKEQEVFMGDFPLMTPTGTFIINGAERVIVSQLVRSPGVYYASEKDQTGKDIFTSTVIPNRGAWIELETEPGDKIRVRIDRTRKMPVTYLLRALGFESDEEILALFDNNHFIRDELERDDDEFKTEARALEEVYKHIRPNEPTTSVENAQQLLNSMFFDPKRYDLASVGRYKIGKKLGLKRRLLNKVLAEDLVDNSTGEILIPADTLVTEEHLKAIDDDREAEIFDLIPDEIHRGYLNPIPVKIKIKNAEDQDEVITMLCAPTLPIHEFRTICIADIISSIGYLLDLMSGVGNVDDIDHLGNRRVRSVGELLQNQFRIGLARMERVVRDRMTTQDSEIITPQALINIKPVIAAMKEFFGSSQLSQFMDQHNPLSELTHKRRLSALGPGGLSRERAGFEVRDVHNSHYGRMCPIETPEGPNIGLINSLASYARINEYGFIEAPYRKVDRTDPMNPRVTDEVVYMTADEEDNYHVAQASTPLDEEGYFVDNNVSGRYRTETSSYRKTVFEYMDVSPRMVFSVATSLVPFLQNDDANRALMGSNMQRQAVPLLTTEAPAVGTGMEAKAARDSGVCVIAPKSGVVEFVDATTIKLAYDDGTKEEIHLSKFERSNQSNCYNQKPIVFTGERVREGQIIADGPSTCNGELALGKNPLIGFMTWEGYNYEDAVLLSERLVRDDVYTSVHIEEYDCEARDTKLGAEEITRDVPGVGEEALKDLDEMGIIRIGAEVRAGDILVGKVTPKGETELTAEEKLLRAIFGEKAREVRDTSLKVPHGEYGIIVDTKVFERENGDELSPGVNKAVRIYIAQKRKISVGDKMAGRHGNKGVVSRVLPIEDMPYLPNGRPLDIVLNPLGVPSRMNIGQILEIHLSLAAEALGFNVATPNFDGASQDDIMDALDLANDYVNTEWDEFEAKYKDVVRPETMKYLYDNRAHRELWKGVPISRDGKVWLRDGRTGELFDNPVTIGHMHYLKLHHLVDDKIHARSTGPYSLVTQQPLGGKAQFGGQRFGEMEVWALEAYGAAYTLQEILTIKSDDVVGRVKTYEAIIKGENIPESGIPESFKVLLKELQALGLDVQVLDENGNVVEIKEDIDYGESSVYRYEMKNNFKDYGSPDQAQLERGGFSSKEFNAAGELEDVEPDMTDTAGPNSLDDIDMDMDDLVLEANDFASGDSEEES